MSIQSIKAGSAFVEVSIRDKTGAGLAAAQAKLKAFAHTVKSVAQPLQKLAMDFGIIGGAILAPLTAAANTFMTLGKAMGNANAIKLQNTWKELNNVFKTMAFVTGEALAPALNDVGKVLVTAGFAAIRFIQTHQGLVIGLAIAGVVAIGLSVALGFVAVALVATAAAALLLQFSIAPLGLLIGGVAAAAVLLTGSAILVANNWDTTKAVVVTAFEAMAISANTASQEILDSMKRAFSFSGWSWGAAMAGVIGGVMKQGEGGMSAGLLGKGVSGAAQLRSIRSAAEGFGVSVTKSASGVGRVGPSSIQKVNDTLTHERLKEILDELKKPGGAKFD